MKWTLEGFEKESKLNSLGAHSGNNKGNQSKLKFFSLALTGFLLKL